MVINVQNTKIWPKTETENNPKKIRKDFKHLTRKWQLERTDELMNTIHRFVQDNDSSLTVTELLGFLIYRENNQKDGHLADIGSQLFSVSLQYDEFSVMDAVTMMHDLVLTKEQLRKLRRYLSHKGVHFPTTNDLVETRKKLKPVVKPLESMSGVFVDYEELVKTTAKSILEINKSKVSYNNVANIKITFKDGCDGAGSQTKLKSTKSLMLGTNIFQYGIVPLRLLVDDNLIWKNGTPNSAFTLRPNLPHS